MYGELIPQGGGDNIPLIKPDLLVGRRESCDVVLRYPNVSSQHCRLTLESGYWYVEDLNSSNGTRVNSSRVTTRQRLDPNDYISFAKYKYQIIFNPAELGAEGPPPVNDDDYMQIMNKSLLDKAGLTRKPSPVKRADPTNNSGNQIQERRRGED
jgi:pSer/pThr/pTyr-binding forkhead associated (FHA) protein